MIILEVSVWINDYAHRIFLDVVNSIHVSRRIHFFVLDVPNIRKQTQSCWFPASLQSDWWATVGEVSIIRRLIHLAFSKEARSGVLLSAVNVGSDVGIIQVFEGWKYFVRWRNRMFTIIMKPFAVLISVKVFCVVPLMLYTRKKNRIVQIKFF